MAMFGGSMTDFINAIRGHRALDNDMVVSPLETESAPSKPMHITPDQSQRDMQMGSDKRNIIDDKGNIVDMDWGDQSPKPFSLDGAQKYLQSGKRGTVRNFLQRILGGTPERNNKPELSGGAIRDEELLGSPSRDQTQPSLAPKPADYSMKEIAPDTIEVMRQQLYRDAGQGAPPLATANQDPNSLGGRMNSPNSAAEQRGQMQEGQDISDQFSLTRKNKASPSNPFSNLFTGRQT